MYSHAEPLTSVQKKAIFAACAAAIVAMDSALANTVFAYVVESYPDVPYNTLYLFQSVGHMVGMFAAFVVGPLTMIISPKKLIETAIAGMLFVGAVLAFLGGRIPYWALIACAAIDGAESSIISCLPAAVVAVQTNSIHQTVKYSGYVQACTMTGGLFFSLIGGYLGTISWQAAYGLYFISLPILIIVIRWMPDKMEEVQVKHRIGRSDLAVWRDIPSIALWMFFQYLLFYVCTFTFKSVISEYVVHTYQLGTSVQVGLVNSVLTCSGILIAVFFGRVSHMLRRWVVPVLALCMILGYVSMSVFTTTLMGCLIGAALIGFAKGGMMPAVVGELTARLPERVVPLCVSLLIGYMNLGMAVSMYLINPMAYCLGGLDIPHRLIASILMGVLAFLVALGVYVLSRRGEPSSRRRRRGRGPKHPSRRRSHGHGRGDRSPSARPGHDASPDNDT